MNAQICSHHKFTNRVIGFLFVFLAIVILSSCSLINKADNPSCTVDMGMPVTIDVTDVNPKVVFDQLAPNPDCAITVSPFVRRHVSLHVHDATVSEVLALVCSQTDSKYTYDGQRLVISRLTWLDKRNQQAQEEWQKKFEVRMPEGMVFKDATARSVLVEISKVSGLEITPRPYEDSRKVTLDISGKTVDEALKAVVIQIDGNGAVMVKTWTGGTAEHRLVDRP